TFFGQLTGCGASLHGSPWGMQSPQAKNEKEHLPLLMPFAANTHQYSFCSSSEKDKGSSLNSPEASSTSTAKRCSAAVKIFLQYLTNPTASSEYRSGSSSLHS